MKKLLILIAICLTSCGFNKEKVDLIIINANIYTVDDVFSKATSLAVKDGKFVGVGTTEEIQKIFASDDIVDGEGQTIVPGLIDAHCHFYGLGLNQQLVDLVGTSSFAEVLERIGQFRRIAANEPIRGSGWDQNDWKDKQFPSKSELDGMFPDIPVVLERVDGHAYLVNQKALDMAGITADTKVEGGKIIQENGALTGVLIDNPMGLIDAVMPAPSRSTQIKALKEAERLCLDYGLTTVSDAGLDRKTIELIDSLQQSGDLLIRIYAMVGNTPENLDHYLNQGILKTDRLNVRSVKVYGDGALGSRGAALKEPYSDQEEHFGAMVTPVSEIKSLAERIASTDYQMNTHAIGDSANKVVLKIYSEVLKEKGDRRWRIEHAQVVAPEDFHYFGEGILPSVQPTHATSDMYWAGDRLGQERIKGAYAFKKLLLNTGKIALGTDFPVEQVNPFLTFYAAVGRKDNANYPENGFQIKDALTREETLKGMTLWAAYANFEENEKGSIEVGKMADFVILSADIMKIPLQEIQSLRAERVYLDGKLIK